MAARLKPIVLITGAAGNIGTALAAALKGDYRIVGMDREGLKAEFPLIAIDLTSTRSVTRAFATFRKQFGGEVASVIHLAADFDFTGEDSPLYQSVNIDGTRRLLRALRDFEVGQFVYSGTMLVHAPGHPGERIDEDRPIAPKWAYPKSKAAAEAVIRKEHGRIPYVLLHLAGLYDERTAVPTLAEQIARIYERDPQSRLYSGDTAVGQAMLHKADMIEAFRRVVDRRTELPAETTLLIGEPDAMSYQAVQDAAGCLLHGESAWTTFRAPKLLAKAGAWLQQRLEPVVPDAIDQGEKPFVRPFMVEMADDHYALDISRARRLLGWRPRRRLETGLPRLVEALKHDPIGWYAANDITPPPWLETAQEAGAPREAAGSPCETISRRASTPSLGTVRQYASGRLAADVAAADRPERSSARLERGRVRPGGHPSRRSDALGAPRLGPLGLGRRRFVDAVRALPVLDAERGGLS